MRYVIKELKEHQKNQRVGVGTAKKKAAYSYSWRLQKGFKRESNREKGLDERIEI